MARDGRSRVFDTEGKLISIDGREPSPEEKEASERDFARDNPAKPFDKTSTGLVESLTVVSNVEPAPEKTTPETPETAKRRMRHGNA